MPVRIGVPTGIKGITQLVHGPEYATGVGLVQYGAQSMCGARRGAACRRCRRRPLALTARVAVVDARSPSARRVGLLGVDQGRVLIEWRAALPRIAIDTLARQWRSSLRGG